MTGENVVPDMTRCDFAISFSRGIASPDHMRIPNWVQRLPHFGLSPRDLLSANRPRPERGEHFAAFIFRNKVPFREAFARELASRGPLDCPGESLNNAPAIGGSVADKLAYVRQRRFGIAFENEAAPGYTTEKLPEVLLAGAVPIYWGDPLVGLDFNRAAFLDYADYGSAEALADAVMAIEADPRAWQRMRDQPAYPDDKLPACADEEAIFAFFERIFDQLPARRAGRPAERPAARTSLLPRIEKDFAEARADTAELGFHGDLHLARAIGLALADADILIETGSNRGISLAYAASLRPDIPVRGCEPLPPLLKDARRRTASYPLARVDGVPSPDAVHDLLREFPAVTDMKPVFWLDAHAHGVPLPLGQEIALITRVYPRGHMFIDDFEVPERPWFGFDAYPDGVIDLDYALRHLAVRDDYMLTLPRYRDKTSTHHPLRGWACFSWGQNLDLDPLDPDLYEQRRLRLA